MKGFKALDGDKNLLLPSSSPNTDSFLGRSGKNMFVHNEAQWTQHRRHSFPILKEQLPCDTCRDRHEWSQAAASHLGHSSEDAKHDNCLGTTQNKAKDHPRLYSISLILT